MIASGIWLGVECSWEPITVLFFSLAGFIASDVTLTRKHPVNEHDRELFNKFLNELPYNGSIKFINEWNMAGWQFKRNNLDQVVAISEKWTTPECKFINKKLEELRSKLHNKIKKYLTYLATNTWVIKENPDFSSVPSEWEEEQPKRFQEVVKNLHDSAGEIVEIHRKLVELGIKKGLKKY